MLELYKKIVADLRPTPSKFHYIFNLRDLSRVCNGLTQTNPDRCYPAPPPLSGPSECFPCGFYYLSLSLTPPDFQRRPSLFVSGGMNAYESSMTDLSMKLTKLW